MKQGDGKKELQHAKIVYARVREHATPKGVGESHYRLSNQRKQYVKRIHFSELRKLETCQNKLKWLQLKWSLKLNTYNSFRLKNSYIQDN